MLKQTKRVSANFRRRIAEPLCKAPACHSSQMDTTERLPEAIGMDAASGEFDRVKAWLAGGTASAPRSINAGDGTGWTLLMWTAHDESLGHVEFARYLISQGARVDARSTGRSTALHFACRLAGASTAANDMVSLLVAAGAPVNAETRADGDTPLLMIRDVSESTIDVVSTLLRAGASLDSSTRSFEERCLNRLPHSDSGAAIRTLVTSVRTAGSWKAHCKLAHKEVLRLRSLVARGRVKLPSRTRRRSPRGRDARQERALEFLVRQGDNGIVWNILSYWRETG